MKLKIIIGIIFIGFFIYCEDEKVIDEDTPLENRTENSIHSVKAGDVEIIVIDDCEYIIYKETDGSNRAYGFMAHKGNCKNPIHYKNDQK